MEPPSGVAVSVTLAPFATASVQSPVDPVAQAMPVSVTVPFPVTTVWVRGRLERGRHVFAAVIDMRAARARTRSCSPSRT